MRHLVAIGSSMFQHYSFFLPMTAAFWRRVDYHPVLLLVGSEEQWQAAAHSRVSLEALRAQGEDVRFIGPMPAEYEDATIAQCARHHAACLDFPPDDILIPGDADLWPFRREFYYQHDPARHDITLLYSNGYGNPKHFPTNHQQMTVDVWRRVMKLPPSGSIREVLSRVFGETIAQRGQDRRPDQFHIRVENRMDLWFLDEYYSSHMILNWPGFPARVQFVERAGQPPRDRIDRSRWPANPSIEGMTDAHLPRPGWNENWDGIRPLVRQALGEEALCRYDQYRDRYREAIGG